MDETFCENCEEFFESLQDTEPCPRCGESVAQVLEREDCYIGDACPDENHRQGLDLHLILRED